MKYEQKEYWTEALQIETSYICKRVEYESWEMNAAFDRRVYNIYDEQRKKILYRGHYISKAAMIVIALLSFVLISVTVSAFSVPVRQLIEKFLSTRSIIYYEDGEAYVSKGKIEQEYALEWPEEYELTKTYSDNNYVYFELQNSITEQCIYFWQSGGEYQFDVDAEELIEMNVLINSENGIYKQRNGRSMLIWTSYGYDFCIIMEEETDADTMIFLAETLF